MKPFHPLATLTIFGCLLVPFALSTTAPRLEPYPSIVLPGGADQVRVDQREITSWQMKLWGKNEKGTWIELDPRVFLSPIPVWYVEGIVNREFGLSAAASESVPLLHFGRVANALFHTETPVISRPQPSRAELSQTRAWLRAHLHDAGATTSVLRVTIEKVVFEIPGAHSVSRAVVVERVYQLDQAS